MTDRARAGRKGWFALAAGLILAADQAVKGAVATGLPWGSRVPLWGEVLALLPVLNPGASFGILAGSPLLPVGMGLSGVLWMLALRSMPAHPLLRASAALVAGGALSNGLDRLRLGGVVDVLVLGNWLAFNLADVALLLGALLGVAALCWSRKETVRPGRHMPRRR